MNAVATALWGTFIGTAAGYLGVISWKYANFLYLIGFYHSGIPVGDPSDNRNVSERSQVRQKEKLLLLLIVLPILAFCCRSVHYIYDKRSCIYH